MPLLQDEIKAIESIAESFQDGCRIVEAAKEAREDEVRRRLILIKEKYYNILSKLHHAEREIADLNKYDENTVFEPSTYYQQARLIPAKSSTKIEFEGITVGSSYWSDIQCACGAVFRRSAFKNHARQCKAAKRNLCTRCMRVIDHRWIKRHRATCGCKSPHTTS